LSKLAIFGGTFNPIHHGHLLIAEFAREQFALDKVIFVTSGTPPHRIEELLDQDARHEMVLAAVSTNTYFEASDVELKRQGPSYTIDTLRHFQEMYGSAAELNLIIGGDNVLSIASWHRAEEIFAISRVLVAPRLCYQSEQNNPLVMQMEKGNESNISLPGKMRYAIIDFPGVAISSSLVRARLSEGKSVRYMVPREVNEILITKGYYRAQVGKPSRTL